MLDAQISDLEQRTECAITSEQTSATKAGLLRSIPGIGPVSAAMLVAEMPELGRMTAGEAAAMAGLAQVPHDSGARGWGGTAPPGVVFHYRPGRKGEYAAEILDGFNGTIQVDAYSGYAQRWTQLNHSRTASSALAALCWLTAAHVV